MGPPCPGGRSPIRRASTAGPELGQAAEGTAYRVAVIPPKRHSRSSGIRLAIRTARTRSSAILGAIGPVGNRFSSGLNGQGLGYQGVWIGSRAIMACVSVTPSRLQISSRRRVAARARGWSG